LKPDFNVPQTGQTQLYITDNNGFKPSGFIKLNTLFTGSNINKKIINSVLLPVDLTFEIIIIFHIFAPV
jgi:hypothetical protein